MSRSRIDVPREALADLCVAHSGRHLALFGSVLSDAFRPDSDVDVLVEFHPEQRVGYLGLARMQIDQDRMLVLAGPRSIETIGEAASRVEPDGVQSRCNRTESCDEKRKSHEGATE